ncbi:hypothetical protein [Mesorhizobium delmotii]|uniref:hypothetical protein n=1 Tax=Mesorhizobium delmotii TaxID=1631247 RepID=UPI0010579782|nr:hypothetical protein [Mesorhizobium delmotii]
MLRAADTAQGETNSPYSVDILGILAQKRSAGEGETARIAQQGGTKLGFWIGVVSSKTSQSQTVCEMSRGKKSAVHRNMQLQFADVGGARR